MSDYAPPLWSSPPLHNYYFDIIKDGGIIATEVLYPLPYYVIGRLPLPLVHISLSHPSISRYHAIIQHREDGRIYCFDKGTPQGTFKNKIKLTSNEWIEINVGDMLRFGCSSRLFLLCGPEELRPAESIRMADKQHFLTSQQMKERKIDILNSNLINHSSYLLTNDKKSLEEKEPSELLLQQKKTLKREREEEEGDSISWGFKHHEDYVDDLDSEENSDSDRENGDQVSKTTLSKTSYLRRVLLFLSSTSSRSLSSSNVSLDEIEDLPLTQKKKIKKLLAQHEKMMNLIDEYNILSGKEHSQEGGLTEGQRSQMNKNEKRIEDIKQQIGESCQLIKQQLKQTKSFLDGTTYQSNSVQKNTINDDYINDNDEEDEFYDRTKKSKLNSSNSNTRTISNRESDQFNQKIENEKETQQHLQEQQQQQQDFRFSVSKPLTPYSFLLPPDSLSSLSLPDIDRSSLLADMKKCTDLRDSLRIVLRDLSHHSTVNHSTSLNKESSLVSSSTSSSSDPDSLEIYMSDISKESVDERKNQIKFQLQQLQLYYLKLQSVLKSKNAQLFRSKFEAEGEEIFSNKDIRKQIHLTQQQSGTSTNEINSKGNDQPDSKCNYNSSSTSDRVSQSDISISSTISRIKDKINLIRESKSTSSSLSSTEMKETYSPNSESTGEKHSSLHNHSVSLYPSCSSTSSLDRVTNLAERLDILRKKNSATVDKSSIYHINNTRVISKIAPTHYESIADSNSIVRREDDSNRNSDWYNIHLNDDWIPPIDEGSRKNDGITEKNRYLGY